MTDAKEEKILPLSWTAQLIAEIQEFHAKSGMKYTTIGAKAIQNARMWERLQSGGTITLEKADQVRAWLAAQDNN